MAGRDVVVVGAGPYGLSVAAHLRAAGIPTRVLGRPFSFWRSMPERMSLRSPWGASSLSDPGRRFTLDAYVARHHIERQEPVPISLFIEYGAWFQDNAVGEVEPLMVSCIEKEGKGFCIRLDNGSEVLASRVVIATGIHVFPNIPDFARGLPRELVPHSGDRIDFDAMAGKSVAVIGAGQSALETAVFLQESGADVEVITRGPVRWTDRRLYELGGLARKVFYPPADVGPVGLNWLVATPGVFRLIPETPRLKLGRRAVRPSGAKWLKERFAPQIKTSTFVGVESIDMAGERLRVGLSDGSAREYDRVVLGTGYRPDIASVPFLGDQLRSDVHRFGRYPHLDQGFETSVRGLHFVGAIACGTFGPICKFVAGAGFSAGRVARAAMQAA